MSSRILRLISILLIVGLIFVPAAVFADPELNTVHGTVFYDSDQNGIFDPGEGVISGITVELYEDDAFRGSTTTNTNGFYEFSDLLEGSYKVVEIDPVGHDSTTANEVAFTFDGVTLVSIVDFGDVLATEAKSGSISGTVFDDINRNREIDGGDIGLRGVSILLKDAEGSQVAETTTIATGSYSFASLSPGTYILQELNPDGYYSTTPDELTVELLANQTMELVDFGDFMPEEGEISPLDPLIADFFDLLILDVLELRSIDGLGYGNIAKVYFLAYLGDRTVGEILALHETEGGWGKVMKEVLGKAGLKGYNLGLIVSGREIPNQVQKIIDECPLIEDQGKLQELMTGGANQGTLKKLCDMVYEEGGGFAALLHAVDLRNSKMKWKDIQAALETFIAGETAGSQGSGDVNSNDNGPPACKGKNKNDPGCK